MERRILHGNVKPTDIAQALMAEFNRGNLHAQTVGQADKLAVQIVTRWGSQSGGQTALTVSIQKSEDGVMIDIGQQAWLGVAASLGRTAFAALRNPFSLLGRLDDLAQDIENLQLQEKVLRTIERAAAALGVSRELSERFQRVICEYCKTANPLGEGACIACGAPLGDVHPSTCPNCGFVITKNETVCPNCRQKL
ncbi:MAG: zinc ribbon domain-containing protein [Anaerolineales bacterium]|nr:zinc ribbon domain-containing protein [Anaerolineales bacterium]